MTKHGLTEAELAEINHILSRYPDIESAVLFGSRAKGNFKKASDVDIAIKGKNLDPFLAAHLKDQIEEETNIPYFFDIIDYHGIDNAELTNHIIDRGVVIYTKKNKTASRWLLLSFLIIVLDQLTKYAAVEIISAHQTITVTPFLNIILSFNAGAAFSFLGSQNGWQLYLLSGISIVVSAILTLWLCRLSRSEWIIAAPISLVLGGALGNLMDRIRFGYVTDFIDFHLGNWHFATFNVADSAVTIGATWLILRLLYESVTRQP